MTDPALIAQLPMFSSLAAETLRALAGELVELRLPAATTLGQDDALYLVVSGKLRVCAAPSMGDDQCVGAGGCMGEVALLTGQPCADTATATEDTVLLRLTRAAFDHVGEAHPDVIARVAEVALPRVREIRARLALSRVFGPLDEPTLRALYEKAAWRQLECGEVLCRQGEPGEEMYIVVQGRLRFAAETPTGERDLGEVGAGESIGEFALLSAGGTPANRRTATVYALRQSDLLVVRRELFESLICCSPQAMTRLARQIVERDLRVSRAAPRAMSATVIAVVGLQIRPALAELAGQLAEALGALGPTLHLDPGRFEQRYGKPGAAQTPCDHPGSLLIGAWLDEREHEHAFLVHDAAQALGPDGQLTPWARRSVENADLILLAAAGPGEPAPTPVETALLASGSGARRELVLLHAADCPAPSGAADWLRSRRDGPFAVQAHHHIRRGCGPDFRRLARRLSGRPVGLALSGGGARGWAHVGVLRAIEEAGLELDFLGGSSMGAILAAAYALDWSAEKLQALAARFSDPRKLFDYTLPYTSIMATRNITALLQTLVGETRIEDTWRPCFCVSANLTRGEEQIHRAGPLWQALRAGMAFPALFAPVLQDGCVLVDGGAANNLPIDRMRELCPTGTVIGVDLVAKSPLSGPYDFGMSLSGWEAALARLVPHARQLKAPTLLDIVAGVMYSNDRYRLNAARHCADLLIRVPVERYGMMAYEKYQEIIEAGYVAAKEQLKAFVDKLA